MTTVMDITRYLDERVPFEGKMDFDNVGLLCGFPEQAVSRVLVALDVTQDVIREAKELGAELIVTHHPLIFHPLKSVLSDDVVGARVIAMIRSGLSAICLHTNLDLAEGGVNDALAARIGAAVCESLSCGRVAELPEAVDMGTFCAALREKLGVSGLRCWDAGRAVRRIALCGGAGGDAVYEAVRLGCDTVLSGEIGYHEGLDGREMGLNIIDADHFCTENVVLPVLKALLEEGFPTLDVRCSEVHSQTMKGC